MTTVEAKEWSEWTDQAGQVFSKGDIVSVATISGKSPQMVIGEVLAILSVDSKGEDITRTIRGGSYQDPNTGYTRYHQIQIPHCKIRVQPLIDCRGFGRWGANKAVTYQFPENIVKLAVTRAEIDARLAKLDEDDD